MRRALLPALVAVVLAVLARTSPGWLADHVDGPVLRWVVDHRSGGLTGVARALTDLGEVAVLLPVGVVVVAVLLHQRRGRRAAVIATVGMLGAQAGVQLAKLLVDRHRPPAALALQHLSSRSMPSGHAAMTVVVWGLLARVVAGYVGLRRHRGALVATTAALALLIGLTRVYLGVHWSTDVVAGWCLGVAALVLVISSLDPHPASGVSQAPPAGTADARSGVGDP